MQFLKYKNRLIVKTNNTYVFLKVKNADDGKEIEWITVKGNHVPIKEGQDKGEAIKDFFEDKKKYETNKNIAFKKAKTLHKEEKLNFKKISKEEFDSLKKTKIHTSYKMGERHRKGSEYWLGEKDGKFFYIRKSDHWGFFSVNKYLSDYKEDYPELWEKVKDKKNANDVFLEELEKKGVDIDREDIYGRLGTHSHKWELEGSKKFKGKRRGIVEEDGHFIIKDDIDYEYYPSFKQIGIIEL